MEIRISRRSNTYDARNNRFTSRYLFLPHSDFGFRITDLGSCFMAFPLSKEYLSTYRIFAPARLPPLDSSSSSESLNTFRHLYAADYEQSIFARIQSLENGQYYNIPPQTRPGEYASIVREHFDQAISVDHLRSALDMEYNEVLIWEKKAILQERLFSFMISEERIDRILQLSPYENIRKEAFEFLEGEVEGLNDLRSEEVRRQMDERLSSILTTIRQDGRASSTYRRFYSHFIDEDFRRLHGLPLP
ncbi:hypothetical protein V6N13_072317 [Hibiscus sabdariffa]